MSQQRHRGAVTQRHGNHAAASQCLEPVRSRSASPVRGRRRSAIRVPPTCGSAVVGSGVDRGERDAARCGDRGRCRPPRTRRHVRRLLRPGLYRCRAGGATVEHLHCRGSTAAAVVRGYSAGLLSFSQRRTQRAERYPDHLRISPDRTLPPDAVHLRRRAPGRNVALVSRDITNWRCDRGRDRRGPAVGNSQQIRRARGGPVNGIHAFQGGGARSLAPGGPTEARDRPCADGQPTPGAPATGTGVRAAPARPSSARGV